MRETDALPTFARDGERERETQDLTKGVRVAVGELGQDLSEARCVGAGVRTQARAGWTGKDVGDEIGEWDIGPESEVECFGEVILAEFLFGHFDGGDEVVEVL